LNIKYRVQVLVPKRQIDPSQGINADYPQRSDLSKRTAHHFIPSHPFLFRFSMQ